MEKRSERAIREPIAKIGKWFFKKRLLAPLLITVALSVAKAKPEEMKINATAAREYQKATCEIHTRAMPLVRKLNLGLLRLSAEASCDLYQLLQAEENRIEKPTGIIGPNIELTFHEIKTKLSLAGNVGFEATMASPRSGNGGMVWGARTGISVADIANVSARWVKIGDRNVVNGDIAITVGPRFDACGRCDLVINNKTIFHGNAFVSGPIFEFFDTPGISNIRLSAGWYRRGDVNFASPFGVGLKIKSFTVNTAFYDGVAAIVKVDFGRGWIAEMTALTAKDNVSGSIRLTIPLRGVKRIKAAPEVGRPTPESVTREEREVKELPAAILPPEVEERKVEVSTRSVSAADKLAIERLRARIRKEFEHVKDEECTEILKELEKITDVTALKEMIEGMNEYKKHLIAIGKWRGAWTKEEIMLMRYYLWREFFQKE